MTAPGWWAVPCEAADEQGRPCALPRDHDGDHEPAVSAPSLRPRRVLAFALAVIVVFVALVAVLNVAAG